MGRELKSVGARMEKRRENVSTEYGSTLGGEPVKSKNANYRYRGKAISEESKRASRGTLSDGIKPYKPANLARKKGIVFAEKGGGSFKKRSRKKLAGALLSSERGLIGRAER